MTTKRKTPRPWPATLTTDPWEVALLPETVTLNPLVGRSDTRRVYEWAREHFGMSASTMLSRLNQLGYQLTSPLSALTLCGVETETLDEWLHNEAGWL